jgi:hypothetical protein
MNLKVGIYQRAAFQLPFGVMKGVYAADIPWYRCNDRFFIADFTRGSVT